MKRQEKEPMRRARSRPTVRKMFIEKDAEQTHLCLGFPGCTFADDETLFACSA